MNRAIINHDQPNYFELFDLPVSFAIDLTLLEQHYYAVQQSVHPDRFAVASEAEKQWAVYYASQVNDAYQVLKHPLKRAIYLLKCAGQMVDFERDTVKDASFLQQQMLLREKLSQSQLSGTLATEVANHIHSLEGDLENLFSSEQKDFEKIKTTVMKLRFFNKLQQEIHQQVG